MSVQDVLLNAAEVRAWLRVDATGLNQLVRSGTLRAKPTTDAFGERYSATEVARLAGSTGGAASGSTTPKRKKGKS